MSRSRLNEMEGLLIEQINPEQWPQVDEAILTDKARELFCKRKKAILMYFQTTYTHKEIKEITSIDQQNLRRLIKRCMCFDEEGVVWGFRALIPNKNVKAYKLNIMSSARNQSRKTGEFRFLLEKYPDIRDLLDDLYLGRNRRSLEPAMKIKHIHKKFIDLCREKEINLNDYPFNTERMGFSALKRYLKRVGFDHFIRTASRHGEDALQKARHTGEGEQNHPSTLSPYQKVQFDAHRIDGFFVVDIMTPEGDLVTKVLDRFWILTLIDVATRVIPGYSISLNKEYSASDVMQCIRNAVMPHKKIDLKIDGLTYHDVGGFPSEVYPESASWAVWNVICFDNAKSHLANLVKDRLEDMIGCFTNLGPVALPMRRGLIERFFKILEESGFHRLPNTTGSNPDDPRRKDPELNAIKWNIAFEHLKELVDVMISNYNGTPHGGIYHQSPLELLGKRMESGLLPRILEEEKHSEMLFFQTKITRTVRGSLESGKKPYVQYEGVDYRSEKLSNSAHLIGSNLIVHVNVDDLRSIKTFLEDGSEFGFLTAVGKWALTAHSLQTRKAINSLVLKKLIHYTTWDDPIFKYTEFLNKQAIEGKRMASNKATSVREASVKNRQSDSREQNEAIESAKIHNDALERARDIAQKSKLNNEVERYESMLEKFKIKSF